MRKRLAFTLIELMVVVSIIGVLASIVLVGMRSVRQKAQDVQTKSDLRSLDTALTSYMAENGEKCPPGMEEGLQDITDGSAIGNMFEELLGKIPKINGKTGDDQYFKIKCINADNYEIRGKLNDNSFFGRGYENGVAFASKSTNNFIPYWRAEHKSFIQSTRSGGTPTNVIVYWPKAIDDSYDNLKYVVWYKQSSSETDETGTWTRVSTDTKDSFLNLSSLGINFASTGYRFNVFAHDPEGNVSTTKVSSFINFSSTDTQAPTWATSGWEYNFYVDIEQNTVHFYGPYAQDASGISGFVYEYKKSSDSWNDLKTVAVNSNYYSTSFVGISATENNIPAGDYIARVKAVDQAGNHSYFKKNVSGTWVDWEQPFTVGTGDKDHYAPVFPMNASPKIAKTNEKLTISWDAANDNVGVVGYRVSIQGDLWVEILRSDVETNTPISINRADYLPYFDPEGEYCCWYLYVVIEAYDAADNSSQQIYTRLERPDI